MFEEQVRLIMEAFIRELGEMGKITHENESEIIEKSEKKSKEVMDIAEQFYGKKILYIRFPRRRWEEQVQRLLHNLAVDYSYQPHKTFRDTFDLTHLHLSECIHVRAQEFKTENEEMQRRVADFFEDLMEVLIKHRASMTFMENREKGVLFLGYSVDKYEIFLESESGFCIDKKHADEQMRKCLNEYEKILKEKEKRDV